MSLTVRYLDIPEGAQEAAQATGERGQSFSNASKLLTGTSNKAYATLEPDLWTLDGTRVLIQDMPKNMGWWSEERSGSDGKFSSAPVITVTFSAPYTASGLTFLFWPSTEQWCSKMEIRWYNGSNLLASAVVYPDEAEWFLDKTVESFNKIEIELMETNHPGQFAKLQMIQIGRIVVFAGNELTKVRLTNEVDPSLCVLSVDMLRVEVRDRKNRDFVPQENQKMELYRDGELIAAHYISDSSREAKSYYTFSCQSAIGLLGDEYLGGMFRDVPVQNVLDDILDGRRYKLDESFQDATIRGYLPVCTRREALQQVAFAIGAMVTTQNTDEICLLSIPTKQTGKFTNRQIFPGAKVETSQRIYRFDIVAHSYTETDESVTLLLNREVEEEAQLFTFYEPHHSYSIEGGEIVDSGVNWVRITASSAVRLDAKTYRHNTAVYSKRNPMATAAERGNVLTVDAATLINKDNVRKALNRLYAAKILRQKLTQEAVIEGRQAGEIVSSVSPWGGSIQGFITSMESTMTQNGHTATVEIMGERA